MRPSAAHCRHVEGLGIGVRGPGDGKDAYGTLRIDSHILGRTWGWKEGESEREAVRYSIVIGWLAGWVVECVIQCV